MVDKRKSPTSDSEASDSGSDDDLEATPSGPGPLKKARIDGPLNGHRQQDLDQVDDSSDEDEDADGEYVHAPTRELSDLQSEISAAVEEDRRQVRETNRTRRGAGQNVGSGASGIIKRIYLENFMCHERLSFDFGENMNFVIGNNGSGKSAVLTAVTIVLGGRTSSTGRGSGMNDLIRSGAHKAVIRIVLKNTGRNPYRADVWGDEITIERVLAREGASSWRIRSALSGERSKPLSTKKETVTAMTDHFDIQVDNPMTILTQDMSRAFLGSSDAHKKYELFLKGTSLQKLINDYNALDQKTRQIDANLGRQKDGLKDLLQASEKWKKLLEQMQSVQAQEELIEELHRDRAWAHVRDKAKEHAEKSEASEKARAEFELAQKRFDDFAGSTADADALIEETTKAHREFQESNGSVAEDLRKVIENYKQAKTTEGTQRRAIADLSTSLVAKERSITELEQSRDAEIQRTGHAGFAEKQQELRNSKTDFETKLTTVQKQLPSHDQKILDAKAAYDTAQSALRKCKGDKSQLEEFASRAQAQLAAAQREQSGAGQARINRYGQRLQAVYAEIDRARWEGGKPIGPLGLYVKVKAGEEQYIKVIESALGNNLVAWAVRTASDRTQLMNIFKNCIDHQQTVFETGKNDRRAFPPILTHVGELFDFSHGDQRHLHKTLLSVLEIEDEHVVRLLVNAATIEKLFVSPTRKQADEAARQMGTMQTTFLTGDMFRVNSTGGGGQSSAPLNNWAGSSMLSTDLKAEIEARAAAVQDALSQVQEVDVELQKLEADRHGRAEAVAKVEREMQQLRNWQREYRAKIQQIDQQLSAEEPVSVSTFTDEIERIRQARALEDEQYLSLNEQLQLTLAHAEELKIQRDQLKTRRDNFAQQLNELAKAVGVARTQKDDLLKGQKNLASVRTKKAEVAAAKAQELQAVEVALEEWTRKARLYCPQERNPTESIERLKMRIAAAEKTRDKGNANFKYPLEVVTVNFSEAAGKYAQAKSIVREATAAVQRLNSTVNDRKRDWTALRADVTMRTRDGFSDYLQVRGFSGNLIIDHTHSTLDMKVDTDLSTQSKHSKEKDTRSLSGGETSFTTLCLILAIWYNVKSPLRCLDEFDVYMDAENRKLAMSLLVRVATGVDVSAGKQLSNGGDVVGKHGDERQYILISPQEMSGAKLPPTVKVLRMPDPERGQTRLTTTST
ncbi:hypothetical protein FFLO_00516 [Filobasidium floriforme]|uniref:RecF/RecN/SMC N-terminal domain-containing protein n=1 Tax=Filobasidium floriforme TaxID=5210 RepID=A0A8K0JR99_9TREE|nr:hypothetical protein FFLO_00516 [Filobasidium floriforme]